MPSHGQSPLVGWSLQYEFKDIPGFSAVLVQMVSGSDSSEGACKWRSLAARSIGVDEETLDLTSTMVQRKIYKDLVDFDNHLDDVTQDYLNVEINIEISDQH